MITDADFDISTDPNKFDAFVCMKSLTLTLPRAAIAKLGRVYVIRAVEGDLRVRAQPNEAIDGNPTMVVVSGQARTILSNGKISWLQIADHN